jgi:predicted nucleotidyltransferase
MILDLRDLPVDRIAGICKKYGVHELSVFGSFADGTATVDSDLDLLVEFLPDAQIGFVELSAMQRELADLSDRQVDLVPKRGLKPLIRDSVLSSSRVLYAV